MAVRIVPELLHGRSASDGAAPVVGHDHERIEGLERVFVCVGGIYEALIAPNIVHARGPCQRSNVIINGGGIRLMI